MNGFVACGCGIKFPTHPATKSQSILLHNLDTIQLWTKILVQRTNVAQVLFYLKHFSMLIFCNLLATIVFYVIHRLFY